MYTVSYKRINGGVFNHQPCIQCQQSFLTLIGAKLHLFFVLLGKDAIDGKIFKTL